MTLISNSILQGMRRIANRGLITDVTLCYRAMTTDSYGGDPKPTWPAGEVVKGWLFMTNNPDINDRNGVETSIGIYRLNLPATVTLLNVQDQVEVNGARYTVNDTNGDDSYRVLTTVLVQKLDQRTNV